MNNYDEKIQKDEIDLKNLFYVFWREKIYFVLILLISVFLASMYLQSAERKYTIEYKLKPVGETKQKSSFSGLGGLASLAGYQLPSSSNSDFKIFKELISSVEVSKIIFMNEMLIKKIYAGEWDSSVNNYSKPTKSKIKTLVSDFKKILTGNNEVNYNPPDAKRLSVFISKSFNISEDKETGFLNIKAETSNPELMISLIIAATQASDKIMRQRYIEFSKEPLAFYKDKLRTARAREHRESLAELISSEEQKLMFASRGKYFTAEPYMSPTTSMTPTAPKPKLILVFSVILGMFVGIFFVLIRSILVRDN